MPLTLIAQIGILLFSYALQAYLAPKPEKPKPGTLADFGFPTIEDGTPIGVVFGTVMRRDPQVIWAGDIVTSAIKASGGKK